MTDHVGPGDTPSMDDQWTALQPPATPPMGGAPQGASPAATPATGTPPMHAMGIGEILDAAIKMYRKNFIVLIAISATVAVPVGIAMYGLSLQQFDQLTRESGGIILSGLLMLALVWVVARGLLFAPTIHAIASGFAGVKPTYGGAWRSARPRILSMMWVQFVIGLGLMGAGVVASFILGMIFAGASTATRSVGSMEVLVLVAGIGTLFFVSLLYVKFMFGPAAVMVERVKGVKAIGRSERLTKAGFWRIWLTILLAWGLFLVVQWAGTFLLTKLMPIQAFSLADYSDQYRSLLLATSVVDLIIEIFLAPFPIVLMVLLYFDSRIRLEALDLTVAAHRIVEGESIGLEAFAQAPTPGLVPPPPPPPPMAQPQPPMPPPMTPPPDTQ